MAKFNKDDLLHRIETFIGYGNLDSDFWFIGYEEGCSKDNQDVQFRLRVPGLQDIFKAHKELKEKRFDKNALKWFEEGKYQTTWGALIKILLIAKGYFEQEIATETLSYSSLLKEVKHYQSNLWGRFDKETLVAELLPLPSISSSECHEGYKNSDISFLKSRKSYTEAVKTKRIEFFKKLLAEYNPKVVIAYGKEFWEDFKKLASSEEDLSHGENSFFEAYNNIVLIKHPASKGVTNRDLIETGCWIRDNLIRK